jgi:hypothetical protein
MRPGEDGRCRRAGRGRTPGGPLDLCTPTGTGRRAWRGRRRYRTAPQLADGGRLQHGHPVRFAQVRQIPFLLLSLRFPPHWGQVSQGRRARAPREGAARPMPIVPACRTTLAAEQGLVVAAAVGSDERLVTVPTDARYGAHIRSIVRIFGCGCPIRTAFPGYGPGVVPLHYTRRTADANRTRDDRIESPATHAIRVTAACVLRAGLEPAVSTLRGW